MSQDTNRAPVAQQTITTTSNPRRVRGKPSNARGRLRRLHVRRALGARPFMMGSR